MMKAIGQHPQTLERRALRPVLVGTVPLAEPLVALS
jgi:hypothetical protein